MNPDPLLTVLSSKTISTKSVIKQIRHFVETHSTDDASNAAVNATHYLSDEITEKLRMMIDALEAERHRQGDDAQGDASSRKRRKSIEVEADDSSSPVKKVKKAKTPKKSKE